MGDDKDEGARMAERNRLAVHLAKETGISEAQARDLIGMLGTDRNSLLREARLIYGQRLRYAPAGRVRLNRPANR